jgi:hypothetical protein
LTNAQNRTDAGSSGSTEKPKLSTNANAGAQVATRPNTTTSKDASSAATHSNFQAGTGPSKPTHETKEPTKDNTHGKASVQPNTVKPTVATEKPKESAKGSASGQVSAHSDTGKHTKPSSTGGQTNAHTGSHPPVPNQKHEKGETKGHALAPSAAQTKTSTESSSSQEKSEVEPFYRRPTGKSTGEEREELQDDFDYNWGRWSKLEGEIPGYCEEIMLVEPEISSENGKLASLYRGTLQLSLVPLHRSSPLTNTQRFWAAREVPTSSIYSVEMATHFATKQFTSTLLLFTEKTCFRLARTQSSVT